MSNPKAEVKLSKTTLERTGEAKRYATGQDTVDLDPRERLIRSGLGWNMAPEIVVTAKSTRSRYGWREREGKTRTARNNAGVSVVDGEIMLDLKYTGYAFGKHDPYQTSFSGERKEAPKPEGDPNENDRDLLLRQADKVAKALQAHIEANGEPIPTEDQVKEQQNLREIRLLDNAIYHLDLAVRDLGKSDHDPSLDLKAQIADVKDETLAERNVLDLEVVNIRRKREGKPELTKDDLLLTG